MYNDEGAWVLRSSGFRDIQEESWGLRFLFPISRFSEKMKVRSLCPFRRALSFSEGQGDDVSRVQRG